MKIIPVFTQFDEISERARQIVNTRLQAEIQKVAQDGGEGRALKILKVSEFDLESEKFSGWIGLAFDGWNDRMSSKPEDLIQEIPLENVILKVAFDLKTCEAKVLEVLPNDPQQSQD